MRAEKLPTEQRQQQLTRAMMDIIARQGLKKLSVARVARRVGLVPSAVYRHFKNKEEMIHSCLDFLKSRLHQNLREVCQETSDPVEQFIRENQAIPKMIFSEDIYHAYPETKARLRRILLDYLGQIAQIFRQGQKERKINKSSDPETLSLMLLGLFQPAGILWFLSDGNFDVTKHVQKAWGLFRKSIQGPDSRKTLIQRRKG